RSYPQFTPNDDNRNLRYTYLRLSGVVFYQMDKRIKLFARGELWRRTSNNLDRTSLSFRDYSRTRVMVGVRVEI
ncbi:MAG: hypothetical protein AAGC47_10475, partial [Bacteroidota bacterium]